MASLKQQKKTDTLGKKLANKIKRLEHEINELPAYPRRKKDKKIREIFRIVLIITALMGILTFGAGCFAVTPLGTILSPIILGAGLFLSLAIGLSADLLHRAYVGIRDLFAPEKIKIQNKDYDNGKKSLIELQALLLIKGDLSKKIKKKISLVKDLLIPKQDVNTTIKALETIQKNHPTRTRKQKDKENWAKLFRYSHIAALVGIGIYFIGFIMLGSLLSASLFLGLVIPPLFVLFAISISILTAPLIINSVVYAAYLGLRNLFNAEIRSENKQYHKLGKIIHELEKLSEKQDELDSLIKCKLEKSERNDFALTEGGDTDTKVISFQKQSSEGSVNNNKYSRLFTPLEVNKDGSFYNSNITKFSKN